MQETFDIPLGFEDYREMLDEVPMDGVVVASPHVAASSSTPRGARRAAAMSLVEKPLTTNAADARDTRRAGRRGRPRDHRALWLELQAVGPRGARELVAAGEIGEVEHVVLQMASALEDLFAGQPMKETEGAMFRPPASTWADPKRAGGYGWGQLVHALGLLFRIADLEPARSSPRPASRRPGSTITMPRWCASPTARPASLSGASTVPKHRGFQIDLRIFGSEGMLLLDIERERLEVRRRDGRDEVVPMAPGEGAYSCDEPLTLLVDLCLGRAGRQPLARASSACAPSRCSTPCTARRRAGRMERV